MNAGSFLKYINTPSLLHQLPYEELKTMVLQYPFSANLHMLLLLKSKQENHKDYEKNLAMAASHSINRSYLYKLLHNLELMELDSGQLLKEDEILELKDLASLEKNLEKEWVLLEEEETPIGDNINGLGDHREMEKAEEIAADGHGENFPKGIGFAEIFGLVNVKIGGVAGHGLVKILTNQVPVQLMVDGIVHRHLLHKSEAGGQQKTHPTQIELMRIRQRTQVTSDFDCGRAVLHVVKINDKG